MSHSWPREVYNLLAGRPPFPEGNSLEKVVAHMKKEPPPLTAFRSDLPAELLQVVGRMMAKDPARRYQSPAEAARALLEFRKTGAVTAARDEAAAPPASVVEEPPPTSADVPRAPDGIALAPQVPAPDNAETFAQTLAVPPSRSRSPRKRNRRPPRGRFALTVTAIALGLCLLAVGTVLIVVLSRDRATNRAAGPSLPAPATATREEGEGELSVASRDPNLQLAVRQGTRELGLLNPVANPRRSLPVGEYQVEVVAGAPELRGMKASVVLARGDRKIVDVRREGPVVFDARTGFPPPPGPFPPPPNGPPGR